MTATLATVAGTEQSLLERRWADAERYGRRGVLLFALLVIPALAWLVWAPITSAVVAPAVVKVDLDVIPIQHAEGGSVAEVRVRDGQQVRRGDVLLVLGDVSVRAEARRLDLLALTEQVAIARHSAEQTLASTLRYPDELLAAARTDRQLAELLARESALFRSRREALDAQLTLLDAQRGNLQSERAALRRQVDNATISLTRQQTDLDNHRRLRKDGYVSDARVTQLEATVADYAAQIDQDRAELARAEQRAVDVALRRQAVLDQQRQEAGELHRAASVRLADVEQQRLKSRDAADRQDIVAPVDGVVMNLRITTPGTMLMPRQPVADIVPSRKALVVDARIEAGDAARIEPDRPVRIRLPTTAAGTGTFVEGRVTYVAPDRTVDERSGRAFYSVLIEILPESLSGAQRSALRAGLPVEVYLPGERRSALEYLLEPITDVMRRGARER